MTSLPDDAAAPLRTGDSVPVADDPPPDPVPLPLTGNLDSVAPDGTVVGWSWSPVEPTLRREVAVWIDGLEVVRTRCDQPRPDLLEAGAGDGAHGMKLKLPAVVARPGCRASVTLRDVATGWQLGRTTEVTWEGAAAPDPPPPPPSPPRRLHGNLDRVTRDGWVLGWCWCPDDPGAHVEVAVLVDDQPVGTARAVDFRPDLQAAGIGDGTHGFSYALSWSALADKGLVRITARDAGSGARLGEPILLRAGRMALAEDRILQLEREIRLLRSQLEELTRLAQARNDERAAHDLFTTVGRFFQALAEGDPAAAPGGGLKAAVEDITARFAPVLLAIPDEPLATVCIAADAAIDTLYQCIVALHEAGVDARADIVLLDDGGRGGLAALLPAVAGNLRYQHLPAGGSLVAARNAVASAARGRLIAFLAPQVRVRPGWLDELAGTFAREPEAAMVTAKVVRGDGLLHATGILVGDGGILRDPGHLAEADDPAYDFMRPVDAVGDVAFAVRRDVLAELGGFSNAYSALPHALFDLCMRLRLRGYRVFYQPMARGVWSGDGRDDRPPVPDLALPDEDSRQLRQHWLAGRLPAVPAATHAEARFLGHALVIDSTLPRPDHDAGSVMTFEQMLLLRRLGYRVAIAAAGGGEHPPSVTDALRRNGIEVVAPPAYDSIMAYLEAYGAGLDLVQVYRHACATMFFDRVRSMAPQARLLFVPADLHHVREAREAALTGAPAPDPDLTRERELDCIRGSDATILHSDYELALLHNDVPSGKLRLLRWIAHSRPPARGFAGRHGLCFVGSFRHPPNADGVQWFVAEVLPLVLRALPDLRLRIVGADPPDSVRALASANVEVLGWVADLDALFEQVRLSVAPLRYGAGFKGKVATSLACGLPVVGTTIALEGTGLAPGDGVAVADAAAAFADEVVRLHEDEAAWTALAAAALRRCHELYSPQAALELYRRLLTDLGLPVPAG